MHCLSLPFCNQSFLSCAVCRGLSSPATHGPFALTSIGLPKVICCVAILQTPYFYYHRHFYYFLLCFIIYYIFSSIHTYFGHISTSTICLFFFSMSVLTLWIMTTIYLAYILNNLFCVLNQIPGVVLVNSCQNCTPDACCRLLCIIYALWILPLRTICHVIIHLDIHSFKKKFFLL